MKYAIGLNILAVVVSFLAVIGGIVLLIEHVEMSKYYWILVGYSASTFVVGLINLIKES
jgi:hypothetical protein